MKAATRLVGPRALRANWAWLLLILSVRRSPYKKNESDLTARPGRFFVLVKFVNPNYGAAAMVSYRKMKGESAMIFKYEPRFKVGDIIKLRDPAEIIAESKCNDEVKIFVENNGYGSGSMIQTYKIIKGDCLK